MRFNAFVGGSYTAKSVNIAAEEAINLFAETAETAGAQAKYSYLWSPGLLTFVELPESPVRGQFQINGRYFAVGGSKLIEVASDGTQTVRATIANDGTPVSICASAIQLFIVSAGAAYCYTLATNVNVEVTKSLAAVPLMGGYGDGYFAVMFKDSNKFQFSDPLDGTVWPGIQVSAVSVFPENISSIIFNHRDFWVMGKQHIQPYTDTGTDEVYDVIPGALIEKGCGAAFSPALADNSIFWVDEDERGARTCWRMSGYTPQRISTHAVEIALQSYPSIADLVSYSYQDGGHLFWVLYIPGTDCSWVYDVSTSLWAKRAEWHTDTATYSPHRSWNYCYVFDKHLVGDWQTGKIYEMSQNYLDENGELIRRVRQSPTLNNELQRLFYSEWRVDFDTGLGPQVVLTDGDGNPRPPQAMGQWSNDGGHTWSNEHWQDCGYAGEYWTFVRWMRLGFSRRRVFRLAMTDPIPWSITDSSLDAE